jgi:hypothetical protein
LKRKTNTVDDEAGPPARKGVLFCPDCGRIAPLDEWEWVADDDAETLRCPDCGAILNVRRYATA